MLIDAFGAKSGEIMGMPKREAKNRAAAALARRRWAGIGREERSKLVPHNGGRRPKINLQTKS